MDWIILRITVAIATFVVGVVLTGAWNTLCKSFNRDTASPVSERTKSSGVETASGAERELLEIYERYAEAQTKHDAAFFERTEASEFILFERYGKNLTRTEDIELLKTLDPNITYTIDNLQVQVNGDVAAVTGRMTATYAGGGSSSWPWIDVCVKRNGRWQILSTTQGD
jgi:ketosteroid isomerase-like protein